MTIQIDPDAGFCFGVSRAIKMAEEGFIGFGELSCLGQIVHNNREEDRLRKMGIKVIGHDDMEKSAGKPLLIRAHGEPPSTYKRADELQIPVVDATCPIVKKLQDRVAAAWRYASKTNDQIVIVGKKNHPEVLGLIGQMENKAIVIEEKKDVDNLDFSRPVVVFAQTTADTDFFDDVTKSIKHRLSSHQQQRVAAASKPQKQELNLTSVRKTPGLEVNDTICRHVKNRRNRITAFARTHDLIIFVGSRQSSNGRFLFAQCKLVNERSFFVEDETDIRPEWLKNAGSIGITGATSTPPWLLKKVDQHLKTLTK